MDATALNRLLEQVRDGTVAPEQALVSLRNLEYDDLGFARVDHHRALRQGWPEVIYGAGKTPEQVAAIAASLHQRGSVVLATRASQEAFAAVQQVLPSARYHATARLIEVPATSPSPPLPGPVGVIAAGTSDQVVAEEAACTLEAWGAPVVRLTDVGVSGLHRLLRETETLRQCRVLIVVAGMEGALPSVVGGLVEMPVIAVPTSVGYGAAFGGLAALLGMLNTCAKGVAVVNIDNGFGAAAFAATILREIKQGSGEPQAGPGELI